ncbi:MAG: ABC transporter ATP-binding protein, partial [Aquaticitalea sp.]
MPREIPKSLKDDSKTSLKKSFSALIFIPRFFREVWNQHKRLFLLSSFCRLIGALLPVAILWVGKLIIDEIVLQIKTNPQDLTQLWTYVTIEFGLVIISDLIGRAITLTDSLLGDAYSIESSVKIIKKTNQIDISLLEDSEFYDKLERARTQTAGRVGLMSNALGELQSLISIGTLVVGLIYFEPYLIILLVLSIIPSFINEIWFSQQQYSLARGWTAERRELDYLRFIGANNQTAKEIKLFGLTDFLVNRFKNLSQEYYELNKTLVVKRSALGFVFNVLGTLSYYGAYIFIIYRVISGVITLGELTFLSGAFNRLTRNLQDFFSKFTRITESALYLKDYFEFIDISIEPKHSEDMPLPAKIKIGFEFKEVQFAYPDSEHEILRGVSFYIKVGEKIAFVGQ